jgi:hypothetical protein
MTLVTSRRQTLAIKGFLTMGCTSPSHMFPHPAGSLTRPVAVTGLVFEAESALMAYEKEVRVTESALRKEARLELGRRGIVGTETAIAKWKADRQRALDAAADADTAPA